jgi:hypothetical protein
MTALFNPARKIKGRECGALFGGETGFNKHRLGDFTRQGPDYGRRCTTAEEMLAKGFELKAGVWLSPGARALRNHFANASASLLEQQIRPAMAKEVLV